MFTSVVEREIMTISIQHVSYVRKLEMRCRTLKVYSGMAKGGIAATVWSEAFKQRPEKVNYVISGGMSFWRKKLSMGRH